MSIAIFNYGKGGTALKLPEFTYTGAYSLLNDGDDNWRIKFLTSGTLTFTDRTRTVDAFLVGAGGGAITTWEGGAGGGYTNTQFSIVLLAETGYVITIGAGVSGGSGGQTAAFGYTANGGNVAHAGSGANGGSGGGGRVGTPPATDPSGGEDGSDGATSYPYNGGVGQGTTTREFGETGGDLYAGGGGGGCDLGQVTQGGYGGGGNGAGNGFYYNTAGIVNTGGGAGGGGRVSSGSIAGGSGIVVIRNHREAE